MTTTPPDVSAPRDHEAGQRLFWAGALVAFVLPLVVYARTMQGSASFWDSGEFIAAAWRLGIPHSPGTPLYVLVGRVFTLLPLPLLTVAQKVNLLSAFCGAAGILFAYMLVVRFLDFTMGRATDRLDAMVRVAGALTGVLFLAFSDTYWTNATEAEVYAMSNALMGFLTWLALKWGDAPRAPRATALVYLMFYLLALSVGFHLGTILAFSGIFFFILSTRERTFSTGEFLVACAAMGIFVADATLYRNGQLTLVLLASLVVVLALMGSRGSRFPTITTLLFVLGLSVHLYLKIRSAHNPTMDEGDPETWRALYAVLRREQYPPTGLFPRKAPFSFQLQHFNGYFQAQFELARAYVGRLNVGALLPIGLGIWGMVDQYVRNRRTWVMLFVTFLTVSLGLIVFLNFSDHEVRERDYFYSPAFYYFAVCIGAASLLAELRSMLAPQAGRASPAVAGLCAVMLVFPFVTLKHYWWTHDRWRNTVCPRYARNMLVGLEPNAIVFTNGDNDTFPLWYIQDVEGYRTDVRVVNLSLLNTPWYIRQCRDNAPRVPMEWTDEQIRRLRPVLTRDGVVLVRDLAIKEILRANFSLPREKQRPVYFAVTIPAETYAPYRKYLEMEGLEYRIVRRQGENMINVSRMERNLMENYDYTGILTRDWKRDTSLYQPPYVRHLVQNYAAAFVQLAYVMHQDSVYDRALRYLEIAHEISPDMEAARQMIGLFRLEAGDTQGALAYYRNAYERSHDPSMLYRLAGVYERLGDYGEALDLLERVLAGYTGTRDLPGERDLMLTTYYMARRGGLDARARGYLDAWLAAHPGDAEVRRLRDELERPADSTATR